VNPFLIVKLTLNCIARLLNGSPNDVSFSVSVFSRYHVWMDPLAGLKGQKGKEGEGG